MSNNREENKEEIPIIIHDTIKKCSYKRLDFFGKGGFAKCYKIMDMKTNNIYAGKVISKKKSTLKIADEISIHRSLQHKHVVGFHNCFEDPLNFYIVLELCEKGSMIELYKQRRVITEPEARYYMQQILLGVQYLHSQRIIHRDLKLGNFFLNEHLHVKIGDFGLSTIIELKGQKKFTICGTPNFLAPEVINKEGYSFEADIWSLGCTMYILLVGEPPFETSTIEGTYARIRACNYRIPRILSEPAQSMIADQLQPNPAHRPSVEKLLQHEFFTTGLIPATLPLSCLTTAPRVYQLQLNGNNIFDYIAALHNELMTIIYYKKLQKIEKFNDEMTDSVAQPHLWVSKWTHQDKYGFGYELCDDSLGVKFNDNTKVIMLANKVNVHYIDRYEQESYMTMEDYPEELTKKMKLLMVFRQYMSKFIKTGGSVPVGEIDGLRKMPYMHKWFKTNEAIVMFLTNGTLQINFYDHMKIILCPFMSAVSYIDKDQNLRTFRFSTIKEKGCEVWLHKKLMHAMRVIQKMLID